MRYAIVSDIHANLQAWEAVLRDIASSRMDGIICLGDVLGYGPNPAEVLQSVHRHVDAMTLGNHDAVLCGKLDPVRFNDHAREMIDWTRTALAPWAADFLSGWPLVLVGDGFRCAHGDFAAPGAFNYVIDPYEALPSWQETTEPLLFTGHTHLPGIFVLGASGAPHFLDARDFVLEKETRYLVSAGSVGFPRDADPRASYCIYDSTEQSVTWRRIPFDIDAYRRALAAAGLPAVEGSFLDRDPLAALPPIRAQLGFSPAAHTAEHVKDAVPEQDLAKTLRRGLARWKVLAGLLLLVALITIAFHLSHAEPPHDLSVTCPAATLAPWRAAVPAGVSDGPTNNLLPPVPAIANGAEIGGWQYRLDNRTRQSVIVSNGCLLLTSHLPGGRIRIEAAPVDLEDTAVRRVCLASRVRKSADFSGTLELVVDLVCEDAGRQRITHPRREQKEFRQLNDGTWSARKTFDLLKDTRYVTLAVEGTFTGSVTVAELTLSPAARR